MTSRNCGRQFSSADSTTFFQTGRNLLDFWLAYGIISPVSRGVAQLGSAPEWGSGSRGFESRHSDQRKSLSFSSNIGNLGLFFYAVFLFYPLVYPLQPGNVMDKALHVVLCGYSCAISAKVCRMLPKGRFFGDFYTQDNDEGKLRGCPQWLPWVCLSFFLCSWYCP